MEKCHVCGAELPDNANFCLNCGTKINKQNEAEAYSVTNKTEDTLSESTSETITTRIGAEDIKDTTIPSPTPSVKESSTPSVEESSTALAEKTHVASKQASNETFSVTDVNEKSVEETIEEYAAADRKKRKKIRRRWIIALLLIFCLGAGVGAYFIITYQNEKKEKEAAEMRREEEKRKAEEMRREEEMRRAQREQDSLNVAINLQQLSTEAEFHTLKFLTNVTGERYSKWKSEHLDNGEFIDEEYAFSFGDQLEEIFDEIEESNNFRAVSYTAGEIENDLPGQVTFVDNGEYIILQDATDEIHNMIPKSTFEMRTHQYTKSIPTTLLDKADLVFESEDGRMAYIKKIPKDDIQLLDASCQNYLSRYISGDGYLYTLITSKNVCSLIRDGQRIKLASNMRGEEEQFTNTGEYRKPLVMDIYTGNDIKWTCAFIPIEKAIFIENENTFYYLKEVRLTEQ